MKKSLACGNSWKWGAFAACLLLLFTLNCSSSGKKAEKHAAEQSKEEETAAAVEKTGPEEKTPFRYFRFGHSTEIPEGESGTDDRAAFSFPMDPIDEEGEEESFTLSLTGEPSPEDPDPYSFSFDEDFFFDTEFWHSDREDNDWSVDYNKEERMFGEEETSPLNNWDALEFRPRSEWGNEEDGEDEASEEAEEADVFEFGDASAFEFSVTDGTAQETGDDWDDVIFRVKKRKRAEGKEEGGTSEERYSPPWWMGKDFYWQLGPLRSGRRALSREWTPWEILYDPPDDPAFWDAFSPREPERERK